MKLSNPPSKFWMSALGLAALCATQAFAAPTVTRLTPPSEMFSSGNTAPVIAQFLPGQRFDLQATVRPDDASKTITSAHFSINGKDVKADVSVKACEAICLKGISANTAVVSSRAISVEEPGVHVLTVTATQSDGQTVTAKGNFEVVPMVVGGQKVKNI
ncbi:MAG: alkaline phosphatase, partial [Pseudomonadota bacterium]